MLQTKTVVVLVIKTSRIFHMNWWPIRSETLLKDIMNTFNKFRTPTRAFFKIHFSIIRSTPGFLQAVFN